MSSSNTAGLKLHGGYELVDLERGEERERAPAPGPKPGSSSRRDPRLPINSHNKGKQVDSGETDSAVIARPRSPAASPIQQKLALHVGRRGETSSAPPRASMPELPALGPNQMTFVSRELRDAYSGLQQIIKRTNAGEEGLKGRYVDALSHYVNVASDEVRNALSGSRQPVDPTWRTTMLNTFAQVLGNFGSFTAAAVVENVVQQNAHVSPYALSAIQAGVLAATLPGANVLTQFVGRKIGGTESELRVSVGNHANNGIYLNAAASLAKALVFLVPYGLTHAGLTWAKPEFFNDTVMGGVLRSVLSALALAGPQQAVETYFARDALSVRDTGSNRTDKNGFVHRSYAPWHETKTANMMAKRFMWQMLSTAVGCAVLSGIMGASNEKLSDDPVKHSLASVMGGFSVMFVAMHIFQMIGTYALFDPKRHVGRFTKDANAVLIDKLKASSNEATLAMVGNLRCAISNGIAGPEVKEQLDRDVSVLNGEAFRKARHGRLDGQKVETPQEIVALKATLDRAATEIGKLVGVARFNGNATGLIDSTFIEIMCKLDIAWKAIDNAQRNYLERGNRTLQPDLKNALHRLRDILPSLMQCVTQAGGAGHLDYDPRIREVVESVLPLLVVVDKVDLMEDAIQFGRKLADISKGRASSASTLADLSARLQKRGMADEIVALERRTSSAPEDRTHVLATLERLLAGGKPGATLSDPHKLLKNDDALRVLILMSKLHPEAGDQGALALNVLIQRFDSLQGNTKGAEATAAVNDFVLAFKDGRFTLRQLKDQLLARLDAPSDELVSRGTCETFRKLVGENFIGMASSEEVPADPSRDAIGDVRARVGAMSYDLLHTLWADMEGKPAARRKAMTAIMSLPVPDMIYDVPMTTQNDSHFHSTGYSGSVNALDRMLLHCAAARVSRTLTAAIPHQIPNTNDRQKYYTAISRMMYYVNRDPLLVMQRLNLNRDDIANSFSADAGELLNKVRPDIQVSATGAVPLDGKSMERELNHLIRAFGEEGDDFHISTIGEVTLDKETVRDLTAGNMGIKRRPQGPKDLMSAETWKDWLDRLRNKPDRIRVGNSTSHQFIMDALNAGRAAIIHADRGTPLDKVANDQALMKLLVSLALEARMRIGDPLKAVPGIGPVPDRIVSVVIAHGYGGAKNTKFGPNHCAEVATILHQFKTMYPELKLKIDLAWDYIAHYVAEDLIDSFTREGISEPLVKSIRSMLDTYRSFAAVGSAADTADDNGIRDQASEGRNASDILSSLHMQSLAALKLVTEQELANRETAEKIYALMRANPSGQTGGGNNWLGFFYELKDVLIFGSDALQIGSKTHGAEAYALNMRMFEFMYGMFDAMVRHHPEDGGLAEVTPRIARQNFVDLVDDPQLAERRRFYDRHKKEGDDTWGQGRAEPRGGRTDAPLFPPQEEPGEEMSVETDAEATVVEAHAPRLPELAPLDPITLDTSGAGEGSSRA